MFAPSVLFLSWLLASSVSGAPASMFKDLSAMEPSTSVYPQKSAGDPPYSVAEADLRAAIVMPQNFSFGQKMPVLLSPGTGVTGMQTFQGNFLKQLTGSPTLDPVVLNIPDNLLNDVQINSEYVAYACNYVSAVSNNMNVGIVTWSQGSINMQWAAKYWPSVRKTVSDFVAVSPDIKGSTVANAFGPLISGAPVAPALLQQESGSKLVATLRNNGGDSALVPTTTIYSSSDEIVMPQTGDTASGFFADANGVGVSNSQVQTVCPNQAAGGQFTHEGMLYNSLSYALAMDAFANPGPGQVSRLDLATVCGAALAPGLTAADKQSTDSTISEAAANILTFEASGKIGLKEPDIASYAQKDIPAGRLA